MRKSLLLFVFCLFSFLVSAQTKNSYRLINNGTAESSLYEKALGVASFDTLRFLNKSRMVPIAGTSFVVEIFSAQHLFEKFGKQVSPHTILDETKSPKIRFKLNKNNHLEIEK